MIDQSLELRQAVAGLFDRTSETSVVFFLPDPLAGLKAWHSCWCQADVSA